MTKDKKQQTLVPRLRFPEFRDYQAWTVDRLGNLFIERQETGNEELPLLSLTDKEGLIPQKDSGRKDNSNVNKSKYLRVAVGDIAYNTMRMWEGRSALATNEGLVSPAYTVCVPTDRVDSHFFSYYFKTGHLIREFRRYSQGLVKDTLSLKYEVFSRIHVFFPGLREQQKIAECLGSLDDLIAAEGRKLAALRDHKKGLMQQLFPCEGETRPRLRFPEFRDAGEWKERTIGEFGDIKMCKRILASQTNDCEGVPFYKIGTLGGKPDAYIPRELYEEYRERFSFPKKGEVLITCSGTVGKCVPYDGEDAYYQDSNIVWIANSQRDVSNQFLHSVLLNVDWGRLNSTTITRIYIDDLRMLQIKVPPKKVEQQRIADCLSALDGLIAAQAEKLDALRIHKRGLMQQLFPAPEDHQ